MPSIHPSENPALGWFVPCLAVGDLDAALDFYAQLDLVPYGGDVDQGWAMLRNGDVEIHVFHEHIETDVLNFRGGDLVAIRDALAAKGILPMGDTDFAAWTFLDPDGRQVFFDGDEDEQEGYASGQKLTLPADEDDRPGRIDLGNFGLCLDCQDLTQTAEFYESLGFVRSGGEADHGWLIMGRPDHIPELGDRLTGGPYLALFQGIIPSDMLNFRGLNVGQLASTLKERGVEVPDVDIGEDGGESFTIIDPDGRPVLFDTTAAERLY